jgi:hypothetical protein
MSAGPGQVQRLILERLREKSPRFQRELLWDIAFQRNGIKKDDHKWGTIEIGQIDRSFIESFRRAVKSLNDSKRIMISKKNFTDLDEMLNFLPFLTTRLESYSLCKILLPDIKGFISEKKPGVPNKIDFEYYQVSESRKELPGLRKTWNELQRKIGLLFLSLEGPRIDTWLNIILRGRYLFSGRKEAFKTPLLALIRRLESSTDLTAEETEVVNSLRSLNDSLSVGLNWKIGKLKSVLYGFCDASQYQKVRVKDELKKYLFERNQNLLKLLPGHESQINPFFPSRDMNVRYSAALDDLINRHIFRKQMILELT